LMKQQGQIRRRRRMMMMMIMPLHSISSRINPLSHAESDWSYCRIKMKQHDLMILPLSDAVGSCRERSKMTMPVSTSGVTTHQTSQRG
jgi:hypothetical protein